LIEIDTELNTFLKISFFKGYIMIKKVVLTFLLYILVQNIYGQDMTSVLQQNYLHKFASSNLGSSHTQILSTNSLDSIIQYQDENSEISNFSDNKTTIIDKNINPDQYLLGCNDVLQIYIWGAMEKTLLITINTEGVVVLPLIGPFNIGGKSLSQARQELKEKISSQYKNTKCTIELKSIRQFKIYITGNVVKPGSYIVNAVTRASEAIINAGGVTNRGKLRGIILKNDTYGDKELDLTTFFNSADMEKNPYLKEGDQLFIPFKKDIVSISGSVAYPNNYDFCKGDNLKSIIIAAGGFSRDADTSNIIITRFLNNTDSLETIKLNFQEAGITEVKPDDRIMIAAIPNYRLFRQVNIYGEVINPGVYPIRDDKTTLKEIIKMAGGLTSNASLYTSKITRKELLETGNREYGRLKTCPVQMLSTIETTFLKDRTKEEDGHISINFEKLFQEKNDLSDIILRGDDTIFIAKKELSIKVSGAVSFPGLISFSKGKNVDYYIQQAGGFLPNAQKRKIAIIKGGTNVIKAIKREKRLEAGDVILVPEKKYIDNITYTKDYLTIVGSIATIVLSIFAVSNYINGND
jgi:protein involved in polysaccharide export with SLBB domain